LWAAPFAVPSGGGRGSFPVGDNPRSPIGDHPRSPHRDCTAAAHKDCTAAAHKDCTAAAHKDCTTAAVAAGAGAMNFPRTAHWLEAKEQSSAQPLLPLGQ